MKIFIDFLKFFIDFLKILIDFRQNGGPVSVQFRFSLVQTGPGGSVSYETEPETEPPGSVWTKLNRNWTTVLAKIYQNFKKIYKKF